MPDGDEIQLTEDLKIGTKAILDQITTESKEVIERAKDLIDRMHDAEPTPAKEDDA